MNHLKLEKIRRVLVFAVFIVICLPLFSSCSDNTDQRIGNLEVRQLDLQKSVDGLAHKIEALSNQIGQLRYAQSSGISLSLSQTFVYYSPKGGCTDAIVYEIANAHKFIYVQAYSFTSEPIANALVNADKRGVYVEAVLDRSQRKATGGKAEYCKDNGVSVFIDCKHAIAHNKVIIIDDETLLTGSFNFSKNAETENAENLLIIKSNADLISKYEQNYFLHRQHSEPLSASQEKVETIAPSDSETKAPPEKQIQNEPATKDEKEETVYITKSGKKYHKEGCGYLKGDGTPIPKSKAIEKGYTPCKRCFKS